MYADLKPARPPVQESAGARVAAPAPTPLAEALNARPAVVAQARLAQTLSGRATVQRFERVKEGKFSGKISENEVYVTGNGLSEMYALPGHAVESSRNTGEEATIRGVDYDIWVPSFEVIQDCVAAAEELMHGQKMKYGAPDLSMFRDSAEDPRFFGESDARNRTLGMETNRSTAADPDLGEAFLIARQTYKRDEERPQFHGAPVVARDGGDYVTLESSAPLSGDISPDRVMPTYDMYGSNTRRRQTFKQQYQAEYGKDATVSVLEPSESLPEGATEDVDSMMVTEFVQTKSVTQREELDDEPPRALPVQRAVNETGLPDALKAGVENLSGLSMDAVRVHYNSPQPAALQAHAYAQGADIHVAPGQERHLPHEAWHVVQQAQGRVAPTMQLQDTAINDDPALENEADIMGAKAAAALPVRDETASGD
jgi:hypothetical protein